MSKFTDLRDKLEHLLQHAFDVLLPIGEHVVEKTGQDVVAAAMAGKVHGSDDLINVAKDSLNAQLPELKNTALTAAAALVVDFHAANQNEGAQ